MARTSNFTRVRAKRAAVVARNERFPLPLSSVTNDMELTDATRILEGISRLSLVSCPIALYPATTRLRRRTSIRSTSAPATACGSRWSIPKPAASWKGAQGPRLRALKRPLRRDRGRRARRGQLVSTHTIEIDEFVPAEDDRRALSRPALLHRARRQNRRRRVRRHPRRDEEEGQGRARPHRADQPRARDMLKPLGKGLLGTTLRYPYQLRDEKSYFKAIPTLNCWRALGSWPASESEEASRHHRPPDARFSLVVVAIAN